MKYKTYIFQRRVRSTVQCTLYKTTKTAKIKNEGCIKLHFILAMCCRVILPSFIFLQFQLC